MDNIGDVISSLSSEDIDMLKGVAQSILGSKGNAPNTGEQKNDNTQNDHKQNAQNTSSDSKDSIPIESILGAVGGGKSAADALGNLNFSKSDFEMMMKAKSIFERMNNSHNKNVDLILALRPHLSSATQGKADQAMRILRLFEMLPLFKDLF